MPGKRSSRLCSTISCTAMKSLPPSKRKSREGISGTLTRAKSCSLSPGRRSMTPSETLMLLMNGKRWPGSTASGVRIGKTLRRNHASASTRCESLSCSQRRMRMP